MSDSRIPLSENTILHFPGMECTITKLAGAGSNAIVYHGFYPDDQYPDLKHQVLIKELFPYTPEQDLYRSDKGAVCSHSGEWEQINEMSKVFGILGSDSISVPSGTSGIFASFDVSGNASSSNASGDIIASDTYANSKSAEAAKASETVVRKVDSYPLSLTEIGRTYRLHRQSFERANRIHNRLLLAAPQAFDGNLNTFFYQATFYSVLAFSGGKAFSQELYERKLKYCRLKDHVQRILRLLDTLDEFHKEGLLHLDISPDNILMIGEGNQERISLIDYNSVQTLADLQSGGDIYLSLKQGYSAPEVMQGRCRKIGAASDLYSVTAVFYWMLTGGTRSVMDLALGKLPDLTEISSLKDQPPTVKSKAAGIFRKGFSALPSRRYQDISQMRRDFEELMDRIDGIGITHAALWEEAAANTRHLIRSNPALSFVQEKDSLYSLFLTDDNGSRTPLDKWIVMTTSSCGEPVLITGQGGSGKTTALLLLANAQRKNFHEHEAAILYLSLYGARISEPDYIRNRVLEHLHFRMESEDDIKNYGQAAGKELFRLLSEPFSDRDGKRPKLILLLDGVNEINGEPTILWQEIAFWAQLSGVRMILTSRTYRQEWEIPCLTLSALDDSEVILTLKRQGLPRPEEETLWELLHTPLMLSIYVKTMFRANQAEAITTKEGLLDAYLNTLLEKEEDKASRQSARYWQDAAAIFYVLPSCAKLLQEKGHALADTDLLPLISRCYQQVKTKDFSRVFPQWIGRSSLITEDAESADEWYGLMIHRILWSELGLLVCDDQNRYKLFHQVTEDYLIAKASHFQAHFRRLERKRRFLQISAAVTATASAIAIACLIRSRLSAQKLYTDDQAEDILDYAYTAYQDACLEEENFRDFLERQESNDFISAILSDPAFSEDRGPVASTELSPYSSDDALVSTLLIDGKAMPWSGNIIDSQVYADLLDYPEEQKNRFDQLTSAIKIINDDDFLTEEYADNISCLDQYFALEQKVLKAYYTLLIQPELDGMRNVDAEKADTYYNELTTISAVIPDSEKEDLRSYLETYIDEMNACYYDKIDDMLVVLNR